MIRITKRCLFNVFSELHLLYLNHTIQIDYASLYVSSNATPDIGDKIVCYTALFESYLGGNSLKKWTANPHVLNPFPSHLNIIHWPFFRILTFAFTWSQIISLTNTIIYVGYGV